MNSSTSSSDSAADQRGLYLRILLTIGVGMALGLGIVRVFTYMNDATSESFLGRVIEARAALPRIVAEPDPLVLVFGSSMVEAGFSPREFDQQMATKDVTVKSFNFGFGGLNPFFQDYLSRRIAEAFVDNNRQAELVLIEFNPFQATVTRRERADAIVESMVPLLASSTELWQQVLDDPTRGIRMLNNRYLRDGISAEMITSHYREMFAEPGADPTLPEDETVSKKLRELGQALGKAFEEEYPDYVDSEWSYEWQGGGTIAAERSAETLALFSEYYDLQQADYRMERDLHGRIRTADIVDLNFDETLVTSFIALVKNFQKMSPQVEILLLPKNDDWVHNTPDALARQADVVARIARETGVMIRDYQKTPAVTNDMFGDTTHLNRYEGASAFTGLLVLEYADDLAR